MLSIIVPVYNEEETIKIFYHEINKYRPLFQEKYQCPIELLFVDDGSTDNTRSILKKLSSAAQSIERGVRYIVFSRNFGKEAAIYAGLQNVKGDFIALMDVDLQDPPSLLEEMYLGIVEQKYDCVASRRKTRAGESKIRSFFARCFYKVINKISNTVIVDGARDFRMMTRKMVDAILTMSEYNRFSKGIFSWVGFQTKWLEYDNIERSAGTTKWSFKKLLAYSIDGIVDFSTVPLSVASFLGGISCLIALLMIVIVIVKTLWFGESVAGYPSLVCIILFIGGIQLLCLGILGKYLSKTYLEVKKRPIYLIKEYSKNE